MSNYRREYDDDFYMELAELLNYEGRQRFWYRKEIYVDWYGHPQWKLTLQSKDRDPNWLLFLASDVLDTAFSNMTNSDACMISALCFSKLYNETWWATARVRLRDYLS